MSALMRLMLTEVRSLRGWGSSKRLVHTCDEEIVQIGVDYMQTLLASFRDGTGQALSLACPRGEQEARAPYWCHSSPKGLQANETSQ